jgi:hypothetical protein
MTPSRPDPGRRRAARTASNWRPSADAWTLAAITCLFGGAVLLVVAWYDISGTANVYEQLPYLVSAGFTALALIIVGSALTVAGRNDRVERRLAQLVDALTEAAVTPPAQTVSEGPASGERFLVTAGGATFHRPDCLLLRDKQTSAADPAAIAAGDLTPCPVCQPPTP